MRQQRPERGDTHAPATWGPVTLAEPVDGTDNRPMRTIENVMNTTVITAIADERLSSVRDRMLGADIECVPVLDDSGEVCGIVTVTDMMERWDLDQTVGSVMAGPVVTVGPNATTVAAARAMLDNRLHHLVVVADGVPRGVVSSFDLLREIAAELDESAESAPGAG